MIVARTRIARYGPRSFRVVAPQIWNMLPPHLKNINVSRKQFKSSLKTWLFVQDYSQEASLRNLLSGALQILDLTDLLIDKPQPLINTAIQTQKLRSSKTANKQNKTNKMICKFSEIHRSAETTTLTNPLQGLDVFIHKQQQRNLVTTSFV